MSAVPSTNVRSILAVNFNHDGAAALLVEGELLGFVNTERRSRKKKHPGLREDDLDELLAQAGLDLAEVDHVLLCNLHNMDSPDVAVLHGNNLKETWLEFWVNQRNDTVRLRGRSIPCTVNPDHHLLHASAAFFTSPFASAVSLAIDPLGCRAFIGRERRMYPLRRRFDDWFNANVGYGTVAEQLFGSSIVGAGKVMGLAPFGRPRHPVEPDPRQVTGIERLMEIAGADPVLVEVHGRQLNATLAWYIQLGLELQLSAVLDELAPICRRNSVALDLCLSGGTALNAVANELCFARSQFQRLHLHPACGDDGTAIGAALWYWHDVLGHPRRPWTTAELMYSRRVYPDERVRRALAAHADRLALEPTADPPSAAAELLASGAVVGWFQGGSEIGPRALGHRSILADPRDPAVKDRLNQRIKFREHFRPFAPSVLDEHATAWFGLRDSPFMLRTANVLRDSVPAITHVDGTARIQTVSPADDPCYHELIQCFHRRTGVPMVLNTSLNVKGEPIAETPEDAIAALLGSELDGLVFPGAIVRKRSAGSHSIRDEVAHAR